MTLLAGKNGIPNPDSGEVHAIQIPHHYFNGFEVSTTLSDIGIMIMVDGQPQAKLALSFTTAKTLSNQLSDAIALFEKRTKNTLLVMDDVRKALESSKK